MEYFLSEKAVLKWLETPSVYHIGKDDLYEIDSESFDFLKQCASDRGCLSEDLEFIDYCLKEGILTKNRVLLKRPPVIKSPVPSLRYIELQITNRCNLKCKHCYIENKSFSELSVSQIKAVLKEFEEMQGLRVLITGGEPLIHNKFEEINEILLEFFIRKILFTNGLLLNKRILKNLNVDEIQISIDGLEAAHDSLRGRGTFRKALEAVRNTIDSGFDVSISTMVHTRNLMVHTRNLKDFDEMEKLFRSLDLKSWTVDVPCITGRLKENFIFHLTPEEGGKYFKYGYGEGFHSGAKGYACGLHLMGIMSNGNVAKCSFYSDSPIGKIKEGLRKCWQRIKPIKLNELKCDCQYIELCRGGCRYRASLLGDPTGKDLYKCYYYDKIEN
jgi:radical SAM protein with 4Fe4S-binding SPASM domain